MPMLDNSDHQSLFLDNNNISNHGGLNNNNNWGGISIDDDDNSFVQSMSPMKLHNSYYQQQKQQLHHNLTPIKFNDNNNDDHSWLSTPITSSSSSQQQQQQDSTLNSSFSPSTDLLFPTTTTTTTTQNNNNEGSYYNDMDFTNYQHNYQAPIQERYITTTNTNVTPMTPKLSTPKPKINMSNMVCKSCSGNGKSIVKLKPNHISFMEVMFMCPEKDCVFPILDKDIDKFIFPAAYFKSVKKE